MHAYRRAGLARRPYRNEIGGTIARASIHALGIQAIPDFLDAGAAARAGAAAAADFLDRTRAIIDHSIESAIAGGVAEADQHVL